MYRKLRLLDIVEDHQYQKSVLITSVIALLALELFIYLGAASYAGSKSRVLISDRDGNVVYETAGRALTSYDRLVFENTFGPLSNYKVNVEAQERGFPFRAWLAAAVGIPVGLILLLAFLVRVYLSLMYGEGEDEEERDPDARVSDISSFGSILRSFQRFSIYSLGFLLVISVLVLWMVPNFIGDVAKFSLELIREFKWFFLGVTIFLLMVVTWVIYLRYKLSSKMLDNQVELEKFRIEQRMLLTDGGRESPLLPEVAEDVPVEELPTEEALEGQQVEEEFRHGVGRAFGKR